MNVTDPLIGRSILQGEFQIVERLGHGSMATVYRATQVSMSRDVAIKIMHLSLSNRRDLTSRFRREARAMSHLCHPNTIRVFLYGELSDGALYIIMEYLRGEDLQRRMRREGTFAVTRALRIIFAVCGAFHEAHALGIVHRDVKPENIYLCNQGNVVDFPKVLDFGLAKVTERQMRPGSIALTQEGMVFGTPEFMSPEQAMGRTLDGRSDIYSLAVVLYEMLTGHLPFDGRDPKDFVQAHVTAAPIPIHQRLESPYFSEQLWQVLKKGLAKAPADRFQTAEDLARALEALIKTEPDGLPARSSRDVRTASLPEPPGGLNADAGHTPTRPSKAALLPSESKPLRALQKRPKVFLSYSHDSPQHAAKVRALADALRGRGIDSALDQYLPGIGPEQGWPAWMQDQIEESDCVLMVCTPVYRKRLDRKDAPKSGHGAMFEGHLLLQLMYDAGSRRSKLLPILFDDERPEDAIPLYARAFSYLRLPENFDGLLRALIPSGHESGAPSLPQIPDRVSSALLPPAWRDLARDDPKIPKF